MQQNMNDLTVSVYIPAYNAEETIKETLESLNINIHKDIKFFVINDGSEDKTVEIVKSFKIRNLKLINLSKNIGLARLYNRIFDTSKTDLTFIFHADDIYDPKVIPMSIYYMTKHQDVGACFSMSENYYQYAPHVFHETKSPFLKFNQSELIKNMCKFYNFIMTPSACIRTKVVRDNKLAWGREDLEQKLNQGASGLDLQLWLDVATYSNIGFINECLFHWRQHNRQMSKYTKKGLTTCSDFIPIMEHYVGNTFDQREQKKIKIYLDMIKFKEFVIAKLNSIIQNDNDSLINCNRILKDLLFKNLKFIIISSFIRKRYLKYFFMYLALTFLPYSLFKPVFLQLKNKYFLEF